jgi:hypothetical protein
MLLEAIDRAARTLRRDLGEARATVSASPGLPDVTTRSLAALHEYALALDAERRNQQVVYRGYLLRAVELDPDFAVAHAKLAEHFAFNNDVPQLASARRSRDGPRGQPAAHRGAADPDLRLLVSRGP